MNKAKKILLAVAIVAIVAILFTAKFTSSADDHTGSNALHQCVECEGAGKIECPDCEGAGFIEDDDGQKSVCENCNGALEVKCPECKGEKEVRSSWWALIPPVIAIGLALITKEVYSSLFVGILAGSIIGSDFKLTGTMDVLVKNGLIPAVSGTAGIFIFLVVLGAIVALVNKAGGSAAFGRWAQKHIKSRTGAMLATFALGVIIFIDDYFNCLTVGSVMRPVTDGHRVSRAKLSYLIDATAAPICMIAPISSWAAAVSSYAPEGQGISLFIRAIPYNFYSLLTLVFIIAISAMKFDYGSMRIHEVNAKQKGDLYTTGEKAEAADENHSAKGKVVDLILPIIILIGICVFALVYNGGVLEGKGFIDAFSNTDATVGLPWGSIIALIFTIFYLCLRKVITVKDAMECIPKGFIAMVPAILILTFATALKNMTGVLGAKPFVSAFMGSAASGFASFLPAIIFLVALGISFATGTSWGTFGILIPIVISIFPDGDVMQIIGMSACLAGSVCGDHCSPISDTTIMSSAGGQCNHINHVSTQIPYALSVAGISFVMYILAGFVNNAAIVLPVGIIVTVGFLFAMKAIVSKKYGKENI